MTSVFVLLDDDDASVCDSWKDVPVACCGIERKKRRKSVAISGFAARWLALSPLVPTGSDSDDEVVAGNEVKEEEGENVEGYGAGGAQTIDDHIPGGKHVHRKGGCRASF
jgi:hypothetical protein